MLILKSSNGCKTAWQFLIKLNTVLLRDPAIRITLLGIYPNDLKICMHRDIYSNFSHNYQIGERICKLGYVKIMEYIPELKRNHITMQQKMLGKET